jgi:hypothetical protein
MAKQVELELRLTDSISDVVGASLAAPIQQNILAFLEEGLIPGDAKKVIVTVSMVNPDRVYAEVKCKPQANVTGFYLKETR